MSSADRSQRRQDQAAQLQTQWRLNRAAVAPRLAEAGLSLRLLESLAAIGSGEAADPDDLLALGRLGLTELADIGQWRLTQFGRGILVDANRADARAAIRQLENGKRRVHRLAEWALDLAMQAEAMRRRAEGDRNIAGLLGERGGDLAGLIGARAAGAEAEAGRLEAQAAAIRARIGIEQVELNPADASEVKAILLALNHEKSLEEKSADSFRAGINSSFRGLWTGAFDDLDFIDAMIATIRRGFTQAWAEGAATCGIALDELSRDEQRALEAAIADQNSYIINVAFDIADLLEETGGGPFPARLRYRAELWHNRYGQIVEQSKSLACADRKAKWVIDPTKDNCNSCKKLNGKVKRRSFWNDREIWPQVAGAWYLDCKGHRCGCRLVDTDEPLSRGPLPSLP